ncbi:MAG: NAD(P)/FAD-dependent oxidoreductase [Eubacteriales bacterium]|jgi:NADPH-dependent 2,4-dienoyl-CoA reductase/sulfur reductase-like enzyme
MDKLIVIGGGPAGLAAAASAVDAGVSPEDILLLERDDSLGGILNQCIHAGFGLHIFSEELTGPEYASRYIDRLHEREIPYVTDAMVLSLSADRELTYVSPKDGFIRLKASAVVIATGCRERTRGQIMIPGTRPAGIFTAGSAQRFVNMENKMPGKRAVILGSGDIGLIMARRLTLEGAKVECVAELMNYCGGLARNVAQCLNDFDIPLLLSHTVTDILGKKRVEGVKIAQVDENRRPIPSTERIVPCDTLLLSVGLIPENELAREAGVVIDPVTGGAVVDQYNQTTAEGIFACGNALQVHDLVDNVTLEAEAAGAAAARYALGGTKTVNYVATTPGDNVRYIVPHKIDLGGSGDVKLSFRVTSTIRGCETVIRSGSKELRRIRKRVVTPGEMESATVKISDIDAPVSVSIEERA